MALPSMWMISYRKDFWNGDEVADKPATGMVSQDGSINPKVPSWDSLKGKRILILVHGFNGTENDILPGYLQAQQLVAERVHSATHPLYDHVIGIVWPGYESALDYYGAEANTTQLGPRVAVELAKFASSAAKVDIVAHSLGNRLILEALKGHQDQGKRFDNFFSLAPAVDDESIEKREKYYSSLRTCKKVGIFHSNEDEVLQWLYPTVEFDEALGSEGPEDLQSTSKNLQSIDCSAVVHGHSDYLTTTAIYDFIRKQLIGKIPTPSTAKSLKILSNGTVIALNPQISYFQTICKMLRQFAYFLTPYSSSGTEQERCTVSAKA